MSSFYRGNTILMNIIRPISRAATTLYGQILGTPSTLCVITILISIWMSSSSSGNNQSVRCPSPPVVQLLRSSATTAFFLSIPLLSCFHFTLTSQRTLSDLYDSNRERIDYRQSLFLPFLPEKGHVSIDEWNTIDETLQRSIQELRRKSTSYDTTKVGEPSSSSSSSSGGGWALVTGASSGIGRAIAIELARWNIPIVLVARNITKLTELSNQINERYGVSTKIIASDLTDVDAAERLYEATTTTETKGGGGLEIDILVHSAGVGETVDLTDTTIDAIETMIRVNALTGTKLLRLYGKDMKDRRRGRLVVISSITGCVPGVPTTGVYAATKAYQKSLSASMGRELEPYGVGVTLVMPGAVSNTGFAKEAHMEDAFIWKLPFGMLTPDVVAGTTVRSMIVGESEVVVGWLNVVLWIVKDLLPARVILLMCELAWTPFRFPFSSNEKKSSDEEKGLLEL